jgi:predicted Zn-dependent peptidase
METIRSGRLKQQYISLTHESGLRIYLCPMKGFNTAYAMLGTPYGSVDVCFKTDRDEDFAEVPAGIAHFLEHKLFENEDCDAFARYAKTGASANAFTSFNRTCYLFESAENFADSLEILLDFVTHPYFTQQTVDKEQGIIGQEIRMYEDSPGWRVMFNLLCALYHKNPVRIDIAGTVESIAQINADLLYRCYNTFYNLSNMVLAVAGNFDVDEALRVADKVLKKTEPVHIEYRRSDEPDTVCKRYAEQKLAVSTPLFDIGFKALPGDYTENTLNSVLDEMLVEIIAGESSSLYRRLYDRSLINGVFSGESMVGRDYICSMFSGESSDPKQVYEELCAEVTRLREKGIDEEIFRVAKATIYGRYISAFDSVEGVGGLLINGAFGGVGMYELVDAAASVTREGLEKRLQEAFLVERSALSVIWPDSLR